MPTDKSWIAPLVADAKRKHSSVTYAASVRLEEALNGPVIERQLTHAELINLAKDLLADMARTSPMS